MRRVKIEGSDEIKVKLTRMANAARAETVNRIVCGYSAPYAVYVHENLEAYHSNGQAKFLEQPARERKGDIAAAVVSARRSGQPLEQALMAGAEELRKRSQPLVPVATGFLRDSWFAEVERNG